MKIFRQNYPVTLLFLVLLFSSAGLTAQILDPVSWQVEQRNSDNQIEIAFEASMEMGWHLYGTELPDGGPYPTTFHFDELEGGSLVGNAEPQSKASEEFSPMFDLTLSWYIGSVEFIQKVKVDDPNTFYAKGYIEYMACNDQTCLPPTQYEFELGNKLATATTEESHQPAVVSLKPLAKSTAVAAVTENAQDWWQPVTAQLDSLGATTSTDDSSIWTIFLAGFAGGLLALLTPCVWPMIPMTVSFFLKRSKSRKRSIMDALIYGLSIVVIYLILGLAITALFGASALNSLATNALFNLLFFALLVFFAISFLGAFEITLPASWSTKMDSKADATTGVISLFFMAFTLALVSFSCTGPIIGTLLVQAATMGNMTGPAVGMGGFALALAIPFALFAIFPSWLQQMPKSGGWLNSVKVVLGFLELALSLKFLSVADLTYGWGILDREVFLVLWIILFTLLGLYLLGKIKFAHDSSLSHVSVARLFLATISLAFSLYMVPGLWGAPLKAVSAFTPPLTTQDFNLYDNEVHAEFDDYDTGMAYAAQVGKPVLIDFSGFGCVNCRKMEATVWTDSKVKAVIEDKYVLITLIVDDRTPLAQPLEIEEGGKTRTLHTVGQKWSYLQRHKFGANAQPYYVLLNNEGMPLTTPYAYDENVENYLKFLKSGIEAYNKQK